MFRRIKLIAEWMFDQFILPIWLSFRPPNVPAERRDENQKGE